MPRRDDPALACPACGATPDEPCKKMTAEAEPSHPRVCVDARKAAGGVPASNGHVGAGEPPTGRLYGQLAAAAAPKRPSWLLDPDPSGASRREHEVHLHRDATADVKIELATRAVDAIIADVGPVGDHVETGGLLLGLRPGPGRLFISDAGGHGPGAQRKPTSFRSDGLHDAQLAQFGKRVGLEEIGSWHSHPGCGSPDWPSPGDLQAWAHMAELVSTYRQTDPYIGLIITAPRQAGSIASGDWKHPTLTAWIVELGSETASTPWYRCRRATVEITH